MRFTGLQCDYMENPVGFDFKRPVLAWKVEADGLNKRQSAYRVQVSTCPDCLEPLFDSGKVASDVSNGVALEMPLEPCTRYFWRVAIWDERDAPSGFSEAAFFETGRYDRPWQADWIGGPEDFPMLRKAFTVGDGLRSARIYASGVGLYSLFLNGGRMEDEVLAPGFTSYDAWIPYQTYDITDRLSEGENVLGAGLGNGYYKGRVNWPAIPERRNIYGDTLGFIAEIVLDYMDGRREIIPTDSSWQAAKSPFLRAEIYDGEVYDARLEQAGCSEPGFDAAGWTQAVVVSIDKKLLQARRNAPMRVIEDIEPVALIRTPKGETVLDFGQNFAGWVRFSANLPEGERLHLQFGEELDKDGNFYRENMRTALAEIVYISGGRAAVYEPQFTFFGFRYMRVNADLEVSLGDFMGRVVHTDLRRTGSFTCSDERVNRLFLNALWGQKSNFLDVPTDCPQRDERMGWTGDAQVFCATACLNMEADVFYRKYLYDLAGDQKKLGYVPVVTPFILEGSGEWTRTTTGWGDAATIIPWALYLYYGDTAVLEAQYASMKDWVDYMRAQDTLGVDRYYGFHLGDWLAQDTKDPDNLFGLTPTDLIATAYYAYSAEIVSKAAVLLGKAEDAEEYTELAERVRAAFRAEYVSPNGRIVSETQTAQLIALQMNMVLPEQRATVIEHLAERLQIDKYTLTTGFLGTPYLCPVLSENGLNEYAYALLLNNQCPSWLYTVENGATTMWERWNSRKQDGSFGPVSMNSFNHYAFGAIAEWLYRYVAGINPLEESPGFRRMRLAPMPNDLLGHARAEIDSIQGKIVSGWRVDGDEITLEFEIPFGAEAEIVLPDAEGMRVLENGQEIQETRCIRGSGKWVYTYTFMGDTIRKRVPIPENHL